MTLLSYKLDNNTYWINIVYIRFISNYQPLIEGLFLTWLINSGYPTTSGVTGVAKYYNIVRVFPRMIEGGVGSSPPISGAPSTPIGTDLLEHTGFEHQGTNGNSALMQHTPESSGTGSSPPMSATPTSPIEDEFLDHSNFPHHGNGHSHSAAVAASISSLIQRHSTEDDQTHHNSHSHSHHHHNNNCHHSSSNNSALNCDAEIPFGSGSSFTSTPGSCGSNASGSSSNSNNSNNNNSGSVHSHHHHHHHNNHHSDVIPTAINR